MHLPTLLSLLSLALALPTKTSSHSLQPQSDPEQNYLLTTGFQAWIGDTDPSKPRTNWISFQTASSVDHAHYECVINSPQPVYLLSTPCRKIAAGSSRPGDKMWFHVTKEFNEVVFKRLREVDG